MENETSAPQPQEQQPQPEEQAPQRPPVTQEMLDKASKTLATMLDYLGLDATVKSEGRATKINLLVSSDDAGRIIGRKGQSLESLQLLVNRMMQKADQDFPKVYIDIDGYSSKRGERKTRRDGDGDEGAPRRPRGDRDRGDRGGRGRRPPRRDRFDEGPREDQHPRYSDDADDSRGGEEHDEMLRQQAIDAAKEVRRWGESVTLPPMNAHERRIIHITLETESDIQTESPGDGSRKSVVISLKKTDQA